VIKYLKTHHDIQTGGFRGIQVYRPVLLEVQGRVLKVYRG